MDNGEIKQEVIDTFYPHNGSCVLCGEYNYRRTREIIHPSKCVKKHRYDHNLEKPIYKRR